MTEADFPIKQHDTSPAISATLNDPQGNAEDLTGADVRFKMVRAFDREVVIDEPAEVTDASGGKVRYKWASGDTDEPGNFLAEWEVTWAPGTSGEQIGTFPNYEFIEVYISADADG